MHCIVVTSKLHLSHNNTCQTKNIISQTTLTVLQSNRKKHIQEKETKEQKSAKKTNNSTENVQLSNNLQRSDVVDDGHCLLHPINCLLPLPATRHCKMLLPLPATRHCKMLLPLYPIRQNSFLKLDKK